MAVDDWSTTASSNGTVLGIDIAENCNAANVNNAMREIMAQVKAKTDALEALIGAADSFNNALSALNALTPSANKLPYFTGSTTAANADLSAFGRTLIDDADAATACATLGAVRVVSYNAAGNGHLKFQIASGVTIIINWGRATATGNNDTTVSYDATYSSFSRAVVSGSSTDLGAQDNGPGTKTTTTTNFTVTNAYFGAIQFDWIAIGV